MTDWICEILSRHGQLVTIRMNDGSATTRAFIQPVTERREREEGTMTELGALDGRVWLYLGRSAVNQTNRISWNGMEFRVLSSRPYYVGKSLLYWWASLEQAREAAE